MTCADVISALVGGFFGGVVGFIIVTLIDIFRRK